MQISEALGWAWQNPLYGFGTLVGLVLGIFYGFDGWSGNTSEVAFQDSPRTKNFLWVLTGAAAAFFGDIKALDQHADKVTLLFVYLAAFLAAGIFVVLIWGIVIGLGRLVATRKSGNFGYALGDALGDYFYYGYRYYRGRSDAAQENRTARFHAAYRRQLTYSIAAAGSVSRTATPEGRIQVARTVLKSILAVIQSYHNDEQNSNHFRSSLMLALPCDDALRKVLLFVGQSRPRMTSCLKLVAFDTEEAQPSIVLPLSGTLNDALPGAPTAFLHQDGIDVVDDTSTIVYRPAVPHQIREEINAYFKDNPFRSFGSVRIIAGGTTVGVVTVDARITHVFGQSAEEHQRIAEYLLPFCTTLGVVFSHPQEGA